MTVSKTTIMPILGLGALAVAISPMDPANAHHVMDGQLPVTFTQGLLSGLGHPIIGVDHFAFIVAVGIASAFISNGRWMPLVFILATVAGVGLHLFSLDLPFSEAVIATSVLLAGGLLAAGINLPAAAWGLLFSVAGLCHGYAYGESIVGAENSPLLAYFIGFAIIQFVIATVARILAERASDGGLANAMGPRVTAGVVAGVGLVFFAGQLIPA